ncbi:MAG: Fe-S cluster assembly protein IscX [Planctomycetes bacterium]|nr:Fe-S cluster assembly protein IscX [Planctomycetota bacterium]MCB9904623.1 Fe-S cluster assembly protein IscX [Planctomycetota bacterium]
MGWHDTDEIAFRLEEAHGDVDPLKLRFTELHSMITELDGFADDPLSSNEKILEAVLMAWLEERDDA